MVEELPGSNESPGGSAGEGVAGRLWLANGSRVLEGHLLAHLRKRTEEARGDASLLALPVRVVVPSRSLRDHLSAALVRDLGRAAAGVSVQTLYALALEVYDRAGEELRGGELSFPVIVRQAARRQPALRRQLDELVDGYGVVESAVSDLLDAGLELPLVDAAVERLESYANDHPHAAPKLELARATLRAAEATLAELERLGLAHRSRLLLGAREWIERDAARVLPSRGVLIHGFAEATGVASELLEALVRGCGASLLLDSPSSISSRGPGTEDRDSAGSEVVPHPFARRLFDRISGVIPTASLPADSVPSTPTQVLVAPGGEAEVRAVAVRVRALIDGGVAPETIAVVARDLAAYAPTLRVHFRRLGIPFSGGAETVGLGGPAVRRLESLLSLLRNRADALTERWLDACALPDDLLDPTRDPDSPASECWMGLRADLRLGLHHLGAARLREVAELRSRRTDLSLPVRHGFRSSGEDDASAESDASAAEPFAARRRLSASVLQWAAATARVLCERFEAWPEHAPLHHHLALLDAFVGDTLGWRTMEAAPPVLSLAAGMEQQLPRDFALGREDFVLLCTRAFTTLRSDRLGGVGGGVQVLSVMEARSRTFAHLYLLGMNRDVFPRVASEEPLLPDELRRPLRDLLPELPIKSAGYDEERYLFAQLLTAASEVHLSRQSCGEDGKSRAPSPLLQALEFAHPDLEQRAVPPLHAEPEGLAEAIARPAQEHALLAGLAGSLPALGEVLPSVVEARRAALRALCPGADSAVSDPALAAGRLAVLREIDRTPNSNGPLGPYFGFVGPIREARDPRRSPLFVTALEQIARCPWQYFVEKLLRVEATPDPVEALPEVDALMIGEVVHGVLEAIALPSLESDAPSDLESARSSPGHAVPWPSPAELSSIVEGVVSQRLAERGLGLAGLARVLEERVLPYLDRVRALDWSDPDALPRVVGVELEGRVSLQDGSGVECALHFRADRVDVSDERLVLTDYKTGKVISTNKTLEKRLEKLLGEVQKGEGLQAAVYALAAGRAGDRGRYLFVNPRYALDDRMLEFGVEAESEEFASALRSAGAVLLDARAEGSFVPRLEEQGKEPDRCSYCAVREACLRGDSGARGRLTQWLGAVHGTSPASPAEAAVLAVWEIGRVRQRAAEPGAVRELDS